MEEKCCGSIHEWHGEDYQEDCIVEDQPSLSSKEPLIHDIPDPDDKCGEDSTEDDVLPLVLEKASCDVNIHLHEENILAATIISDDDKGLVSHVDIPFQIYEYDDSFDVFERMALMSKPLVDEEISDAFDVSCEEKGGSKDHDGIGQC
jgi:hypothetical protein